MFGHVAFYADLGGTVIPAWIRVAAHLSIVLPILFLGTPELRVDGTGERLPDHANVRAGQGLLVVACIMYLGLTAFAIFPIATGAWRSRFTLYLLFAGVGSVAVAVALARAVRFLCRPHRPPPERPFEPPWVGAYRTRPAIAETPEPPAPRPSPLRDPRLQALGHVLLSLLFVVVGVLVAAFSHRESDRFWGRLCACFFGAGTWVFGETLFAPRRTFPLSPSARSRALAVFVLAGLASLYTAIMTDQVAIVDRAFGIIVGTLMALLGVPAMWRARHDP
ncbi:Hypothetical protein A7982_05994 [Minicystis rosea]|nr:Hypothetical protein A7982_05994 [Minicystis rosea]